MEFSPLCKLHGAITVNAEGYPRPAKRDGASTLCLAKLSLNLAYAACERGFAVCSLPRSRHAVVGGGDCLLLSLL